MTNVARLICANAAIPFSEEKTAFPPLTCQIEERSLVCFLGQRFNILNLYLETLAGLTEPDSGTVEHFIREQSTSTPSHFPPIAYLSHHSALLSVLNGLENVKLPALYHQLGSREEIEKQAEALINELKYQADYKVLPAFMTMLRKRHLLIARALMLKPQVLFIENPFTGLEIEEATLLGDYLGSLVQNKNLTLITSNATLEFVEHYAKQIIYTTADDFHFFNDWQSFFAYKQLNRLKF
jgi:ABC-type multidrug transport system ATPase subunit